MTAPGVGLLPRKGCRQCQEQVQAAHPVPDSWLKSRLGSSIYCWDLKELCFFYPWASSPAGLPSALSSIRGCLQPILRVTACAGAQGGSGPAKLLPRLAWAAASAKQEGLAVAGSCREAGAWQRRQGLSTAVCCQAWEPGPAPVPASTGSALTVSWHHPLGRIISSPNSVSLLLHGEDRPCRGAQVKVIPDAAP